MSPKLVAFVRRRARGRCEYCLFPERYAETPFQVDHVIARKHRGPTLRENLAYACFHCNNYKGPNVAGIDPLTQKVTALFHPRQDKWKEHFQWNGAILTGLSPVGRTTVDVLQINHPEAIALRELLQQEK